MSILQQNQGIIGEDKPIEKQGETVNIEPDIKFINNLLVLYNQVGSRLEEEDSGKILREIYSNFIDDYIENEDTDQLELKKFYIKLINLHQLL